jgi:hypothetical protein
MLALVEVASWSLFLAVMCSHVGGEVDWLAHPHTVLQVVTAS